MKAIKQTYLINAPVADVWKALVDPQIIDKWGGGPAQMTDKVGFEFKLWGGDIHGKNLEVEPSKKLVQDWVSGDWKNPSKVTFILNSEADKTVLELLHENVPDEEEKSIDQGWKDYYLGPLKKLLEEK